MRLERLDGSEQVTRLTSSVPSFVVEASPRRFEVARMHLVLGIGHILTGVDHLLFVSWRYSRRNTSFFFQGPKVGLSGRDESGSGDHCFC